MQLLFRRIGAIVAVVLVIATAFFTLGRSSDLDRAEVQILSGGDTHTFQVEVARTAPQRAQGLMEREQMDADAGMLFVFEGAGERYFWMKDTPLSLDIIFISESGEIIHIANDTTPRSEKIIPSRGDALYVLEVLAGTAKRLGIRAGDQVASAAM
ncbi:MAG: DUF192 domain-containing protein [Rhodobacteraceae bacterium]|nr:DUF192 domain-containing protein [Paracoccaceae bacterium]